MATKTIVDRDVLETIKHIILEEANRLGIEVDKIILFGSRARGDAGEDSDYDILVVIKGDADRRVRRLLSTRVSSRVARQLLVPMDIIITTKDRWRQYSSVVGTIEEVAAGEGIAL
ncbi:MAG: nucleotidyltransferase domain-containing protein [Desulfurococcales archaeon]|nr:nucleotidyltransferase domain-containing protein [Desulfurococcales archaeon]